MSKDKTAKKGLSIVCSIVENGKPKTFSVTYPTMSDSTNIRNTRILVNAWLYANGLEKHRSSTKIILPDGRTTTYKDLGGIKEVALAVVGSAVLAHEIDDKATAIVNDAMAKVDEVYKISIPFSELGQRDIRLMPTLNKTIGLDALKAQMALEDKTEKEAAKA